MNHLPYAIILTSANCGACKLLHTTGNFSRTSNEIVKKDIAGFKWNAQSFWKLITATDNPNLESPIKYIVMEFEFYEMMNPTIKGIKSYTKFIYEVKKIDGKLKGNVYRDTYDRVSPNKDEYTYTEDNGEAIKDREEKGSFNEFLAEVYPETLSFYTIQFPSFLFISDTEYRKAFNSKKDSTYSPYALSYTLITGYKNGLWMPVKKDASKEIWKSSIIKYAEHLSENHNLLIAPEITEEMIETTPKNVTDKTKSVTIGTVSNPTKITKHKSILKNTTNQETEIPVEKSATLPYRIKVVPLNSRKTFTINRK